MIFILLFLAVCAIVIGLSLLEAPVVVYDYPPVIIIEDDFYYDRY